MPAALSRSSDSDPRSFGADRSAVPLLVRAHFHGLRIVVLRLARHLADPFERHDAFAGHRLKVRLQFRCVRGDELGAVNIDEAPIKEYLAFQPRVA